MSIKTIAQLKTDTDNGIYDNVTEDVTGGVLNTLLNNILDSAVNRITDKPILGLREFSSTTSYDYQQGVVYLGIIYQCTNVSGHTGAWNSANFTPISQGMITKTYAQAATLMGSSGLIPGMLYFISDKNKYLIATSVTTFSQDGILKATNPDWQNVSTAFLGAWEGTTQVEYNGLSGSFQVGEIITGGTSGAQAEIVFKIAVNVAHVISKNGTAFSVGETITGGTSGATATTTTITSTSILGTIAINKIVSWNNTHYKNTTGSATIKHPKYDTTNWTALATTDSSYQIEYDKITYNFADDLVVSRQDKRGNIIIDYEGVSTTKFQWGRTGVFGCSVFSFTFENWNAAVANSQLFVHDSACYIADRANISFSECRSRSTTIALGTIDALAAQVLHGNFTGTAGTARHIVIKNFGDVTINSASASVSDCTFTSCNIIAKGTSTLSYCEIDGGTSVLSKTFNNESHSNRVYKRSVKSTFETDITIASTDVSIPFDSSGLYGVYNVTTTGGVANIVAVGNAGFIVRINPVSQNIWFIHNGNCYLTGAVDKLIKAGGDWIEFVFFNSNNREYANGQYSSTGTPEYTSNKATNFSTVNDTLYPSVKAVNDKINAVVEGLRQKNDVVAATTANITLSGAQTIDGVSVIAGDRVLVKDQSTTADNGIYVCASGAWSRSDDCSTGTELQGAVTSAAAGTTNGDTTWRQTSDSISLGVTSIVWAQMGAAVPDATSSTKGKAKLYTDVTGSNTDGAPDQNTVKTALALKSNLASPTFTGTPAAPTAAVNTNTTQLATTAFVVAEIAATVEDLDLHLVATFRVLTNN